MTKLMIILAAMMLASPAVAADIYSHEICLTDGGRALAHCERYGNHYLCDFRANPRGSDKGTEICYKHGECFACDESTLRY